MQRRHAQKSYPTINEWIDRTGARFLGVVCGLAAAVPLVFVIGMQIGMS